MVLASMCGSSASKAYGNGGNVNGPVGAAAPCAFDERASAATEIAAAERKVFFRAWRRVIMATILWLSVCGPKSERRAGKIQRRNHNPRQIISSDNTA